MSSPNISIPGQYQMTSSVKSWPNEKVSEVLVKAIYHWRKRSRSWKHSWVQMNSTVFIETLIKLDYRDVKGKGGNRWVIPTMISRTLVSNLPTGISIEWKAGDDRLDKSSLREVVTSIFIASTQKGIVRPRPLTKFQSEMMTMLEPIVDRDRQERIYKLIKEVVCNGKQQRVITSILQKSMKSHSNIVSVSQSKKDENDAHREWRHQIIFERIRWEYYRHREN